MRFLIFHGRRSAPQHIDQLCRAEEVEPHFMFALGLLCQVEQCGDEGMIVGLQLIDAGSSEHLSRFPIIYHETSLPRRHNQLAGIFNFVGWRVKLMEQNAHVLFFPFDHKA